MTAAEALAVLGIAVTPPNTDDVLIAPVPGQRVSYDSGIRQVDLITATEWDATNDHFLRRQCNHLRVHHVRSMLSHPPPPTLDTFWTCPQGSAGRAPARLTTDSGATPLPGRSSECKLCRSSPYSLRMTDSFTAGTAFTWSFSFPTFDAIPTELPGTNAAATPA